jgi:hypothetical protein
MANANGSTWFHHVEPFLSPAFKLLAPIALRLFLAWYSHRAKPRHLSRRERLLVWAVALASAWSLGRDAAGVHHHARRVSQDR